MDGWEVASKHFAVSEGTPPPAMPAAPAAYAGATPPGMGGSQNYGARLSPDGLYPGAPARGFGEAISVCFNKFATFKGRASRSEFWYFALFNVIVGIVTGILDLAIMGGAAEMSPLNSLASLVLLLPNLAVAVRRLHDTDRSGWWIGGLYLVVAVTAGLAVASGVQTGNGGGSDTMIGAVGIIAIGLVVYAIAMLVFYCQRGTPGPNRFG
jgi:uncharacterized membrane protein YhaH (DUF805 family)